MADYYYTRKEEELIKSLKYDHKVFEILKKAILDEINYLRKKLPERFAERLIHYFPHEIEPLVYFSKKVKNKPYKGISIQGTIIENPHKFIENLNKEIKELGYIAFLTDTTGDIPSFDDQIAVIRGTNMNDIFELIPVPYKGINSPINAKYLINNIHVKKQLAKWDKEYGIDLIGAGYNWVEIKFHDIPANLDGVIKEIKNFSSDAFGYWGNESPEEAFNKVVKRLKKEKILYCWWED